MEKTWSGREDMDILKASRQPFGSLVLQGLEAARPDKSRLAVVIGVEPTSSRLQDGRSCPLSYTTRKEIGWGSESRTHMDTGNNRALYQN